MIQIHNITDKDTVENLIIKFDLECSGDEKYLGIFDGENLLAFSQYLFYDEMLYIKYISFILDDYSLYDAMMKSLFYYADLNKSKQLFLPDSFSKFSEFLDFKKVSQGYIVNLNDEQTNNKCKCRKD